jgi:hypothetical protein
MPSPLVSASLAGYRRIGDQWCPPEVVGTERSRLTLPVAAR